MKFSPSTNSDHLSLIIKSSAFDIVFKADEELLESLKTLPADIDFNYPDGDFNTILYLASANNYTKTVEYLLKQRKVDPNVKVSEGLTAAHIAAADGYHEILQLLATCPDLKLFEQDDFDETPLFRAIGNAPDDRLEETVLTLIKKDKRALNIPNEDGIYPIELALERQNLSVLKALVIEGARITQRCCQVAGQMMMDKSVPSRDFGGAFVFFTDAPENNKLRECAKFIITTYNREHLADDLRETVSERKSSKPW